MNDISVVAVVEVFVQLCSKSNDVNLLLRLLIDVLVTCSYFASNTKHNLPYNMAACIPIDHEYRI